MRALLLFNPRAGRQRRKRLAQVEAVRAILNQRGFVADAQPTRGKASGGEQAAQAIANGYEAIFACGGDGTVHDVLQGVAGTDAVLGILPFGSANALAREMGLSHDPLRAARAFSPAEVCTVGLGKVTTRHHSERYFLSMAGAGPDGGLMYRMLTVDRARLGRWHYYAEALRLYLQGPWNEMRVRYRDKGQEWQTDTAVAVMALRIGSLGGVFGGIARGASLQQPAMQTALVLGPAWLNLPLWFLSSWLHLTRLHRGMQLVETQELLLESAGPVHVQADGEWLGTLPAHIQLTAERIRILWPARPTTTPK